MDIELHIIIDTIGQMFGPNVKYVLATVTIYFVSLLLFNSTAAFDLDEKLYFVLPLLIVKVMLTSTYKVQM